MDKDQKAQKWRWDGDGWDRLLDLAKEKFSIL
jgi:hypothetical protein